MAKIKIVLFFLFGVTIFASCNKDEGFGGSSVVSGNIYKILHGDENFALTHDTVPAGDVDVYIQFGEEKFYGDRVKCGLDGSFEFRYLTKGEYTIFSFSELPSGEKSAVKQAVRVESNGKRYDIGKMYIEDGKAFGTSLVTGSIAVEYFNKDGVIGNGRGEGQRVYIKTLGGKTFFEESRVSDDGTFVLRRIPPGVYQVYTFSQNSDEIPYPVTKTVTVTKAGEVVVIGEVFRLKLKA